MRCKYSDKDLAQRLDHTICRYDGLPYAVRYAGKNELWLYSVPSRREGDPVLRINSEDPRFDVSTVPLGYVQETDKMVIYAYRRPTRMYKQGMHADACGGRTLTNQVYSPTMFSKPFENMITGTYPSLENTLEKFKKVDDRDHEVAISRDIALRFTHVSKLVFIFYKNDEVGWMRLGTNTVVVPNTNKGWIISKYLSHFNWKID